MTALLDDMTLECAACAAESFPSAVPLGVGTADGAAIAARQIAQAIRALADLSSETLIDSMAKAAFEFDWPKDKWERLGPGYHQDRYKGMIRAALAAQRN